MKNPKTMQIRLLCLTLLLALCTPLYAADPVGVVTHLSGILTVKRDGAVKVLTVKSAVSEGDVLSTEKEAYARIKFIDNAELVLRPNSQLKIANYAYKEAAPAEDKIALDMVKGGLRAVSGLIGKRNREAVSFNTPTATIGIRGTHFGMLFCNNDCAGVPTASGKEPENGLHADVAANAILLQPKSVDEIADSIKSASLPVSGSSGASLQQTGGSGGVVRPPPVLLSAGQFGYLPPPRNGVVPPLVLVPPNQAVQVRMPKSISQNAPASGPGNKSSEPECIVQ